MYYNNNVAGTGGRRINRCNENVAGDSGRECSRNDVEGDFGRRRCENVAGDRGRRRCDCDCVFECLEELLEDALGEEENNHHKCGRD